MQKEFERSMLQELSFLLGIQISQLINGIFISQTSYVKEIMKICNMEDCKPMCTPMIKWCKLSKEDVLNEVGKKIYRSMIGSLLYVTSSIPYIMHAVRLVAIFEAKPK